jgi:hypothetical protein
MKRLFILAIFSALFSVQQVSAHGSHKPISEQAALELGVEISHQMISSDAGLGFGKLAQSWKSVVIGDDVKLDQRGSGYYVVSIVNTVEKKTLYVLMSHTGEVYDANFTGDFEGLE